MAENERTTPTPVASEDGFAGWIWAGTWIREKVTSKLAIAFVLGHVLGLVGLGWWVWPVRWIDADPGDLKPTHKADYVLMIADSYGLTGNVELARARLESLKASGEDDTALSAILDGVLKDQITAGRGETAERLEGLLSAVILPPPPTPGPTSVEPGGIAGSSWLRGIGIGFFLLLLGGGVLLLLRQLQRRERLRRTRPPSGGGASVEPETRITMETPPESALGHSETTYGLGDESYDVSYNIKLPSGEFLGEYGINELEPMESGEREGVVAFELWLFDKEDVRTETKVLMSEQAFADGAIRAEMVTKGELVQVEEGQVVTLETANLRLDASIVELAYEGGPDSPSFAKLTTRLDVSLKDESV